VTECGKGYGSYAALYTHMKNKHTDIKPPNMPTGGKNKIATQGRPKVKKHEEEKMPEEVENTFCLICSQTECECVEEFDTEEKNKTIEIMGNEKFINLIN
jgi:transcriptional regulator of heat shock response